MQYALYIPMYDTTLYRMHTHIGFSLSVVQFVTRLEDVEVRPLLRRTTVRRSRRH